MGLLRRLLGLPPKEPRDPDWKAKATAAGWKEVMPAWAFDAWEHGWKAPKTYPPRPPRGNPPPPPLVCRPSAPPSPPAPVLAGMRCEREGKEVSWPAAYPPSPSPLDVGRVPVGNQLRPPSVGGVYPPPPAPPVPQPLPGDAPSLRYVGDSGPDLDLGLDRLTIYHVCRTCGQPTKPFKPPC